MLRDGKFIKEAPVRIGCYYMPPNRMTMTREDVFAQELMLSKIQPQQFSPMKRKFIEVGAFGLLVLWGTLVFSAILKFVIDVATNEK